MYQTSQPSRNLSGIWQSFEHATNAGPVDRYEFRRDGERYFVVRPPGGAITAGEGPDTSGPVIGEGAPGLGRLMGVSVVPPNLQPGAVLPTAG